jgi:hypothetical protein
MRVSVPCFEYRPHTNENITNSKYRRNTWQIDVLLQYARAVVSHFAQLLFSHSSPTLHRLYSLCQYCFICFLLDLDLTAIHHHYDPWQQVASSCPSSEHFQRIHIQNKPADWFQNVHLPFSDFLLTKVPARNTDFGLNVYSYSKWGNY